ncbi:MAG: recombinase family protein [Candidatus Moranbacteria bacterium]|nr:recombinase family protein [Candidatus Moranbacteria bacterium]
MRKQGFGVRFGQKIPGDFEINGERSGGNSAELIDGFVSRQRREWHTKKQIVGVALPFSNKKMIKYFIYCRKSSEDEERQILSIEAQLTELREFAKQNSLFVVKEFYESKTAKEPGREIFNEMLSEIEKGNAGGILAWNPDRLARNSIDGGRIIYLVDTGKIKALKFPTFWFEATPQGKFMLSVAFGQAKYYTDNLRENILRGIRQKLRRGELPAKAPSGYFNEPRLRTIEPDKRTFRKVKQALEAFATRNYTLSKIQSKMFSLGLVAKTGKPLHLSTIQDILKNPFYYGNFLYKGELYQGSHKPMISKKLFDKIQQAMIDNGKPRKKQKKDFLFKNFARCGHCGYMITAEKHIKKSGLEFVYYRCTRKSKVQKCDNGFLREKKLYKQVKEVCQKVSLPDEWKEKYLEKVSAWDKERDNSSKIFAQNIKNDLEKVKRKINRLMDVYLDEEIEVVEFQQKKNALMDEKKTLEEKLSDFERKGNHWLELTRNWIIEANQAKNIVCQENFSEMKNFLKTVGSNRRISARTLAVDFKIPWDFLAETNAETENAETKIALNRKWWT